MLLGMYLGSTAYVIRKVYKFIKEAKVRLKKEGYEFVNKDINKEELLKYLFVILLILCPGFNLAFTYQISKAGSKGYEIYKNEMIKSGQIVDPNKRIRSRINIDYMLKHDEELMSNMMTSDELKRYNEQRHNIDNREPVILSRSEVAKAFNDYLLMDQSFEDSAIDHKPNGNAYKKTK